MRHHILLLAVVAFAQRAAAQAPSRTEFVVRKGADTVAIERFSRDAATLSGEISQSNGIHTEYVANLRPDGTVEHVEMSRKSPRGDVAIYSVDFADALVRATLSSGPDSERLTVTTPRKPLPFLAVSFALSEQMVRASRLAPGQSATFTAVRMGVGDTATVTITRFHADSVLLAMPDVQLKVALSPAGEVVGGTHLAQHWSVERKAVVGMRAGGQE